MIIYWGKHKKTAVLKKIELKSLDAFYHHFIKNPLPGKKGEAYFTTASEVELTQATKSVHDFKNTDHYRRNNKTHLSSWCVVIDGDRRTDMKTYCIPPQDVSAALQKVKINHIIYASPSYTKKNPKWRLIVPCKLEAGENLPDRHYATVTYLYNLLKSNGCKKLAEEASSKVLSQMWFLPIQRKEYYSIHYKDGHDLEPQDSEIYKSEVQKQKESEAQTIEEICNTIVKGYPPLHDTIGKYIWGAIKDGRNPAEIIATLHGMTSGYNGHNPRLKARKADIERRVMAANKKYIADVQWEPEPEDRNSRAYTKYPDQGGNFERLVRLNMQMMIYPNRPIAVTAARFQISVLGGRVYTGPTGKGLVQTILLTGRSTIGKSFVKKNSIWLFNNIYANKYADQFLGASYYTSVKNFVEDANGRYSLGSIRTESGQSDKSQAGDMPRVMMYELEAATESGARGYISSGAQNDKVPSLFSPAITTVRESVAEIQNEADVLIKTSVAGIEGRRSYVVADAVKKHPNNHPLERIPDKDKAWLKRLINLTIDDNRTKWDEPLNPKLWITWKYADNKYLSRKQKKWVEQENEAYKLRDIYSTTIYGRMIERVPAYAALLAVCDNPENPVITNEQIDIAEASIIAEMKTHKYQHSIGELSGPWGVLEKRVIDIFSGDMKRWLPRYKSIHQQVAAKELKKGYVEWYVMTNILQHIEEWKILKAKPNFSRAFEQQCEAWNIMVAPKYEIKNLFSHDRKTFKRI